MKKNMGITDSIIRIVLGVALAVAAYLTGWWWMYILTAILIITAVVRVCPLYMPFKLNTAKKQ